MYKIPTTPLFSSSFNLRTTFLFPILQHSTPHSPHFSPLMFYSPLHKCFNLGTFSFILIEFCSLVLSHANWSSVTVGNLRGKFVPLITDYENYLFDNHALEIWQTLNSFIICDDFIWRYQFPFPDFCWFVKYDVPSSISKHLCFLNRLS